MIRRPIAAAQPRVSVVIPTIPENDYEPVVAALAESPFDAFEVVVVEDGDVGVCIARNHGLEAASAPIVAFTDDDCRPPPDWIESIDERFRANPDLVLLEGPVSGGMTYRGTRKYPTCNLAVRREQAIEAGGFRPEYEYWREDTEFGWRLEEAGEYAFAPEVEMVHPPRPRSGIVESNERRLEREYPEKYDEIIVPDTLLGKLNDWLWRRGFWNAIDRVRYFNSDSNAPTNSP